MAVAVDHKEWLEGIFSKKLGKGEKTSFWSNRLIGDSTLLQAFPRLYAVLVKLWEVLRRWRNGWGGLWCWKLV